MKKRKINLDNIPYQVKDLVIALNGHEPQYVRANYYLRLLDIKDAIDEAIETYDLINNKDET